MKKILIILMLFITIISPLQASAETTQDINDFKQFDSFMKRYHEHSTELAYYVSTSYQSNEHYFKENFDLFRNAVNAVYDTNKNEFISKYLESAEDLFSKPIALLATADDLRTLLFDKIKSFFSTEETPVTQPTTDRYEAPPGYAFYVEQYTNLYTYIKITKNGSYITNTFGDSSGSSSRRTIYDYNSPEPQKVIEFINNPNSTFLEWLYLWNLHSPSYKIELRKIDDMNQSIDIKTNVVPPQINNVFNNIINDFNNSTNQHLQNYTPTVQPILVCPTNKIPLIYESGVFSMGENVPITLTNETTIIGDETCNLDFEFPQIDYDEESNQIKVDGEDLDVITQVGDYPECDGILCFVSNIFGIIKDLIKAIVGIPMAIMNGLTDLLKFLFVPSADSFNGFINELNTTMSEKFNLTAFTAVFNEMTPNSNARSVGPATSNAFDGVTVSGLMGTGEVKIIDSTTINAMLPTIHSWIKGFFYVLLAFFNINHLYKLIRGTTIFESMRGKSD